jgi:hypothetical protein
VGAAWRIKPFLEPGERLVWVDRPVDRTARWVGLFAALLALGALTVAVAAGHRRGAGVGVLLVIAAATFAYRLRPGVRASYAASDRGRMFIVESGRTLVFPLPDRIDVVVTCAGERSALDLGTLEVTVEPTHRRQRTPLRLSGVADPEGSARLLRRLASGGGSG